MKKLAIGVALLALAACAGPQRPRYGEGVIDRALAGAPGMAQPTDIVATELAFARLAQEKGQWTAFRGYAADDAVMFVPESVNAKEWLKQQQNPPQSVTWQPHQVWMSCDGSLAVTKGAWQRGERVGYFTTVWQRQDDGGYKWVMDQGDVLAEPLVEPDFIRSIIAECAEPDIIVQMDGPTRQFEGRSDDRTLWWHVNVYDDFSRQLSVYVNSREGMQELLNLKIAASTD